MGLGPPVCLKCMKIMHCNVHRIKDEGKPGAWWCPTCKQEERGSTRDQVESLFRFPLEVQEVLLQKEKEDYEQD